MKLKKKGFTLVELLIAATILGILAVFATTSYRASVAETRWAHAKALADQLAVAVQQAHMDYETLKFGSASVSNSSYSYCPFYQGVSSTQSPSTLIACDYLEDTSWDNEYFLYYICDYKTQAVCAKMKDGYYPVACVKANTESRLPEKYKNYSYCIYEQSGGVEYIN